MTNEYNYWSQIYIIVHMNINRLYQPSSGHISNAG